MNGEKRRRYLEFERPLADLDEKIVQLKSVKLEQGVDISSEIRRLEEKSSELLAQIFNNLSTYQKLLISRHPNRPTTLNYIEMMTEDFLELHGDRLYAEDSSIVGGIARLDGQTVMILGHQKGQNTQDNMKRNFGMPRPEGYRKALRLMRLAEQWKLPIITLIDTPGAYPGLDAEERGQAEAIARNILEMFEIQVPIVSAIIGEGGSGGALAIAAADRLLMMQYSCYSVISPEGCAAITWKDGSYAEAASEALKITSQSTKELGVSDQIIDEPLGGAHRDPYQAASQLRAALIQNLNSLSKSSTEELLHQRYEKYRKLGHFESEASRGTGT